MLQNYMYLEQTGTAMSAVTQKTVIQLIDMQLKQTATLVTSVS